jgi:hypothetical protein
MNNAGGQRNEHETWKHSFDDVTTAIFIVAFGKYNQVLFKDATIN